MCLALACRVKNYKQNRQFVDYLILSTYTLGSELEISYRGNRAGGRNYRHYTDLARHFEQKLYWSLFHDV